MESLARRSGKWKDNKPDQATLVLIVYKVKGIIRPDFLDLFDVLFESHLKVSVSITGRTVNGLYYLLLLEPE